jgi:hypothetical protein
MSKIKVFAMHRKALAPQSTYTDFWASPPKQAQKLSVRADVLKRVEEAQLPREVEVVVVRTRRINENGYVNGNGALRPVKAKISIKVTSEKTGKPKNKRVNGLKVKVPNSSSQRSAEFYKMQPHEDFKRYKGRVEGYKAQFEHKEEPDSKYEKRLNMGFTKKKRYGRFTKNPRMPGRSATEMYDTVCDLEGRTWSRVRREP